MKKIYYITAILTIFVLSSFTLQIEKPAFISKLQNQLQVFLNKNREEKIYFQTDKTIYKPGEYVFFSAFLTDASTGRPSPISNVAYAELYDPKGNLINKLKLKIQEGISGGEFYIDEFMPGGLYILKGYTSIMKDFGEDRFFQKEIQVQKVITPRLLLKPDFEKRAYGPGDEVVATLEVTDLKNQKAKNAQIKAKINIAGQLYTEFTAETDSEGKARLAFRLPEGLNTTDGILQALVSYQGIEESVSRSVPIVLNKIDLKFYPEGGSWISGTSVRMAFEAMNEFGKGADISGEIIDEKGEKITGFESFHIGMGAFEMIPENGKRYYARILRPVGNDSLFELPAASPGFALNLIKQDKKSVNWKICAPAAGIAYLSAQVHGKLCADQIIKLNKGINEFDFDTEKLPAGIAVFTLFDANGIPQCERLVLVNPEKKLNIKVSMDKKYYMPGDQVKVKIETSDDKGNPMEAKLALSVVDEQLLTMADDKQDNILTYLLLSSELKGKVHEPSFYFNEKEEKSEASVDYLLLTHGWRRFNWKDVVNSVTRAVSVPEISGAIYGYVVDKEKKPCKSEVVLMEFGDKKRAMKITTSEKGQFAFLNVDLKAPLVLFVKKPHSFILIDRPVNNVDPSVFGIPDVDEEMADGDELVELNAPEAGEIEINYAVVEDMMVVADQADIVADINLGEPVLLEETVVVGYGTSAKKSITGSVSVVSAMDLVTNSSLNGKIAGLEIMGDGIDPGESSRVIIRGISTMGTGGAQPLIVVDGVPMMARGQNFSEGEIVNPGNINTISVLKDASAYSLYGARAANGVIVITTNKNTNFPRRYKNVFEKSVYNYTILPTQGNDFYESRSYYELAPRANRKTDERTDFRTTVYWEGDISTDKSGKAEVEYFCNDANSAFRITTEGLSHNGLIGRTEYTYSSQMPLSLDAKIPNYLSFSDTLRIPVTVRNNTDELQLSTIQIQADVNLKIVGSLSEKISVKPQTSEMVIFTLVARGRTGNFPVEIRLSGNEFSDRIKHNLNVYPTGFPRNISISGKEKERSTVFHLTDFEPGTLKGEASIHLSILDELFAGVESILREPYGCFEQVSSMTFPNIFVLQLMEATGEGSDASRKQALRYIKNGYDRLVAYEISTGGFEWFGKPPANEALTAYGLVEFYEMQKVFDGVNGNMMNRTIKYLLDRRNPDGTFIQTKGGFDHLSSAPYVVNCAYTVYALAEVDVAFEEIKAAYNFSLKEAENSGDMYRMALVSLAALRLGKTEDYERLSGKFIEFIESKSFDKLKIESTIVRSNPKSSMVETVSLWAVSLMRSDHPDWKTIEKCIRFINSNREYYGYGTTQATSLSLKALTDYSLLQFSNKSDGNMNLTVNGNVFKMPYSAESKGTITNSDFVDFLKNGSNNVKVNFDNPEGLAPYSIIVRWNARTPESSGNCPLKLSVDLAQKQVKRNETVRLSVKLQNRMKSGQPMSMAVIGIPAGLSLQPWQLKELQEKGVFDFYEILDNRLAIYYRELKPLDDKIINLDLKADIPGTYVGAASSGYLYYSPGERHWLEGLKVVIE